VVTWSRVALLESWTSFSASASFPLLPTHHHWRYLASLATTLFSWCICIDWIIFDDRNVAEPSPVAEALRCVTGPFHENLEYCTWKGDQGQHPNISTRVRSGGGAREDISPPPQQ